LGGNANIGNYIAKTGAFAGGNGPGTDTYKFWSQSYDKGADTGGGSDMDFYLTYTGKPIVATYKRDQAANAANNEFGWTDFTNLYPIFTGQHTAGEQVTFTPTDEYAFYFIGVGGLTFWTQSDNFGDDRDNQHFAFFREADNTYWVGMEDAPFYYPDGRVRSDRDYNDMIVRLAPIPEPATMLLLGSGLIGLAGYGRKKFFKK